MWLWELSMNYCVEMGLGSVIAWTYGALSEKMKMWVMLGKSLRSEALDVARKPLRARLSLVCWLHLVAKEEGGCGCAGSEEAEFVDLRAFFFFSHLFSTVASHM